MPQITAQIRGQPLAAAGTWRADGTQREPEMRIGVRGGAIRCFSAPQPRSASLPRRLRCHCSSVPLPAFPRPGARSRPFDPAAVRICCLFVYPRGSLRCFGCSQVKGADRAGERGRGGRLVEVTEITATMEDKMLIKEVLINTG